MFKIKDRVKESSITEGNGSSIVLNDTFGGFASFANAVGSGAAMQWRKVTGVTLPLRVTHTSSFKARHILHGQPCWLKSQVNLL